MEWKFPLSCDIVEQQLVGFCAFSPLTRERDVGTSREWQKKKFSGSSLSLLYKQSLTSLETFSKTLFHPKTVIFHELLTRNLFIYHFLSGESASKKSFGVV
jgi:hypothetical protein